MMILFAAEEMNSLSITSIITAFSGGGFAIWYGYFITTSVIPRIVHDFREEMKLERAFHEAQFNKLVNQLEKLDDKKD